MTEKWKPLIFDEETWPYDVSNNGRIRRNITSQGSFKGYILTLAVRDDGYQYVKLHRGIGQKAFLVHRLVAHVFISPRPKGHIVHHIDRNRANNKLENLEYLPDYVHRRGEYSGKTWLTEKQVLEIRARMDALMKE